MKIITRKIFLVLAIAAVLTAAFFLPLGRWTLQVVEWVRGAGLVGVSVYFATYVAAAVLVIPGSVLTLGAGFLYGPLRGTLLVSPASVAGATLAFFLGRSLARDWIAARVARNAKFAAIDEAVAKNGFKLVLLLRLSPVFPFSVLNYALGLTRLSARDYILGSFLGMLPGTFLYVYLGSLITNAAKLLSGHRPSGGGWQQILFWGGLVATVLVTAIITRIAKEALNEELSKSHSPVSQDASA
jgi:uncharacterized membrane protein YdjX (TVP38/TMEM64 family)